MECIRERCRKRELELLICVLGASLQEAAEDHLGVTLIRSGDSVIIVYEVFPEELFEAGSFWESESGWNHE